MPLKPREMEKLILADGWIFKSQEGSHRHYIHPERPGKARKGYHTLSSGKRPSQKDGEFHPQAGGVKITSACLP